MSSRQQQNRRRLWVAGTSLTALAAAVVTVFGLRAGPATATPTPAGPPAVPVSVATVVQSDVATWDEFSGRLEAVEHVDVRPRVAGTVQAVHFREGALVKSGDLLVTIDPAPYQAVVDREEAQVLAAQARTAYTRGELDRAQRLLEDHAIAQREADERVNAAREAEANLRAAQASLASARLDLGYTQVRAPISGRVGKLEITTGNLVAAGPTAPVLTTLVSVSPIYASFEADEHVVTRALQELRDESARANVNGGPASGRTEGLAAAAGNAGGGPGARQAIERIPVQMGTADTPDTPFAGHLQLVDNQVDARSGTVRVRAVFDNADGTLIPGQFARLRMGSPTAEPALLVSDRAVGTDQDKKFVMVVGQDDKVAWREVTLGAPANGLRVVTSGLKPGERVVVNGLQRVRPGVLVAPQAVAMAQQVAQAGLPQRRD